MNYRYTRQQQLARNKQDHFDPAFMDYMLQTLAPRTILDLGCGAGWYVDHAKAAGCSVTGIDYADGSHGLQHDLSLPLLLNEQYDLVLCLEVAQYMEPESIEQLVRNCITYAGKHVIFSAAHIGQKCPNAVTLQDKPYYIELFNRNGFIESIVRSEQFRAAATLGWLRNNVLVFVKG